MRALNRKTYVLDTCVLLADPNALFRFDEHDVVVPLVVIEELDRKKAALDDVGRNARLALRAIEDLRVQSGGGLREAHPIPGGGSVRIESNHVDVPLPAYLDKGKADHRILCVAIGLEATLVTKDAGLRIKGSQLGVAVDDYRGDTARTEEHDPGIVELDVEPHVLDLLHRDGKAQLDAETADLAGMHGEGGPRELWPNACLILRAGRSTSGLGRVLDVDDEGIATVHRVAGHRQVFGMAPRDVRQTFAIDLLLDPAVPCVSLMGMAGTGKTFLALAGGLEQVLEATAYRRLSVYRPLIAVGKQEVGYLPGTSTRSSPRGWRPSTTTSTRCCAATTGWHAGAASTGRSSRRSTRSSTGASSSSPRSPTCGDARSPTSSWWSTRPRTSSCRRSRWC
jgi:PhoH-like ATPase